MELGKLVDYIIEWNKMDEPDDKPKKEKPTKRAATQLDWNSLLG